MSDSCIINQTGKRENLGITVSSEEKEAFIILNNRISCANQALNPTAIPEDADDKSVQRFINSVINSKSDALFLQKEWWNTLYKKYKIDKSLNVYIDTDSGELYILK